MDDTTKMAYNGRVYTGHSRIGRFTLLQSFRREIMVGSTDEGGEMKKELLPM